MAGTNDFKAIATGGGANVITQSEFATLTSFLANGYSSGVVASNQFNKVIRQSSFISAVIGQLVANANINAVDDGDQLVIVKVETPTNLTGRQKELLEEFAKISGEKAHPMKKGFLDKVMDFLS